MKTSTILSLFISVIATLCLSGCSSMYYAPNGQNVPMFKEKGEVRLSASYSSMGEIVDASLQGFEVQSAFAAGKHFAIMVNGSKAVSANSYDEGDERTSQIEFGAGYFKPFKSDKIVFEAYGGFGGGKYDNHYIDSYDPSYNINTSVNFKRIFVQPSIGFSSPYFGAAFSLRMAVLMYDQMPEPGYGTSYILAEPCFTFRAGWKGLKFQSQVQLSNNLTDPGFPQYHFGFNTGICLTLPVKKSIQ